MNATDPTAALVGSLISLLLSAAVYVWIALALSAVFRKSGVESWKAWVPILNTVVLLQLAGLSGWWLLIILFPVLGAIAFVVVFAFAVYRVSVAFGFGIGMTVLGVLFFPVWASVIGWGSARWVGREVAATPSRRTAEEAAGLPPLPPFPTRVSRTGAPAAFPAPGAADPAVSGFAPPPAAAPPVAPAAPAVSETIPAPAVSAAASAAPAPAPAAPPAAPEVPSAPVVVPPPDGWTPPPLPGRPVSAAAAEAAVDGAPAPAAGPVRPAVPGAASAAPADDSDPWQGFGLDTTDHSSEVTGAFPGVPAPVSAVPAGGPEAIPAFPAGYEKPEVYAPKPSSPITPGEGITRPPVTDVPLPAITGEDREPWAPAHSPMPEADAFPEASGPVSAVAGVAGAGIPFSARSSVSAQHSRPEISDEDDDQDVFDETVIARRKRSDWTLLPPTGDPVALTSDVVILGRRPSADAAFPNAQLVPIQDGTVSKTHARLQLREDRWYVVDLDSTNGVLFATVMGTEVEATPGVEVEAGDRFLLGDAEVRLQRSDG